MALDAVSTGVLLKEGCLSNGDMWGSVSRRSEGIRQALGQKCPMLRGRERTGVAAE